MELAQQVSCEWNLSVLQVTQSLLVAQVLVCWEVLCPVKLVQISTVVDYKLLRGDLPFILQGTEHVLKARVCVVGLIPGSDF